MKHLLRITLLALAALACLQSARAQIAFSVTFAPPALPVYELPVCPADGYIWTPGYWAWDPDFGYYWVPGTWILAPEAGFLWTPPWWGWEGGFFRFHEGYWGPHIGFYGGINYGFGYFGEGFWGGRWEGGVFRYNTAVLNVNTTIIHNTYIDRTVINNTTIINNSHVSYNGGAGGIARRPTPEEERYSQERHIAPSAEQTRHVQAAHSNPELRAESNHGRPSIAATSRPAEFRGGGVVTAREAGGEYHRAPSRNEARPTGEGARPAAEARDLKPHEAAPVNTGDARLDQKYQQQQQKLTEKQNAEHQKLQQQQEKEHQQATQRNYSQEKQQQMEQKHQQQTQQLEQKHQQQTQQLQERQTPRQRPR